MGFLDKVKKVFSSKKEDVGSQDSKSSISKHDVFISYSTKDSEIANMICHVLEQNNLKCWIAPRDIISGGSYVDEIVDAIKSTKIVVLVFSQYSQKSKYVNNEIDLAVSYNKHILLFNIDNSLPNENKEYYLKASKCVSAYPNPEEEFETLILEALKLYHGEISIVDESFNEKEIQPQNSGDNLINDEVFDKSTFTDNIRNFKYLDDLIHSGVKEIVLDSDIVLEDVEESEYYFGIKLDVDDLVIDGNGHKIDVCGKTRMFVCEGENILLKNIKFTNGGFTKYDAGVMWVKGDVTVINSTFSKNNARLGGAIYMDGGHLTLIDSVLKDNTAKSGGAIYNHYGKLEIINSILTENKSKTGGTIYSENGEIIISESTINRNIANEGGAIKSYNTSLTIQKSKLNENTAGHGGAIHSEYEKSVNILTLMAIDTNNSSLTITDSEINNNSANSYGAIYNKSVAVKISGSTLNENKAKYVGCIYNQGEMHISKSLIKGNIADNGGIIEHTSRNFKISDCKISKNKSLNNIIINNDFFQIYGSAFNGNKSGEIIFNDGHESYLRIFNGEFSENDIEKSVIRNCGNSCNIEKTSFKNNILYSNSKNIINQSNLTLINPNIKDNGKTILNEGYVLIRKASEDFESKIYGSGTVETVGLTKFNEKFNFEYLDNKIHESSSKEIILEEDICFENYEIDFYEGGIELDIDNLIINGNGKTIDGAGKSRFFIVTGKNIKLKNIIFKNGCSYKNYDIPLNSSGGAIIITHNAKITIENCKFIDNVSSSAGGVICNYGGDLILKESWISDNVATEYGGAIYNYCGKMNISKSTFDNNSSLKGSGGAIANISGDFEVSNSSFNYNNSKGDGGALFVKGGSLNVLESTLNNNKSRSTGGAISNLYARLTTLESTLNKNTAEKGGAIYNFSGYLTVKRSSLCNNHADHPGGAICNFMEGDFNFDNCEFDHNEPDNLTYRRVPFNFGI
ncbi:TIR domain-containing protein [Methanobrevibacter sp.]|uniref:toll/interleukin-1 receptor domain-containing protein n=1 Tax=Methanobrevibacter sp. TaxID=66852 RepID=UPI00388E1EFD